MTPLRQKVAPVKRYAAPVICLATLLCAAAVNMLHIPILALGFNSMISLPVVVQFLWLLFCVAVLGFVTWCIRSSIRIPVAGLWLSAIALIALLWHWRTDFPSIHGDGENAAPGFLSLNDSWPISIHSPEWRLTGLINKRLTDYREFALPLSYDMGMPERTNPYERFDQLVSARKPYNDTWILLTLVGGVVIIVATLLALHATPMPSLAKLGVFYFVACGPPMLNMFGHFDSYWLSVLWVLAWGRVMVDVKTRLWAKIVAMTLIALLGYWTHPILLLLTLFTMLYVLVRALQPRLGIGSLSLVTWTASVVIGLSPMLHPDARAPEWQSLSWQMLPLFLAERSLQVFATALPALYLGILSIVSGRHYFANQASPERLVARTAFIGTIITYFTFNFTLGPLDFLNMSVLGSVLLVAALILWRTGNAYTESIVCAGLLGAFVFFPQAYTYSRETMVDHFVLLQPQSVCSVNRAFSPYIVLALRCPVESETDKDRFLSILRTGYEHPQDRWKIFVLLNRQYYTAWCYEFGRDDLGRASLEWLFDNAAPSLPILWFDGALLTGRFQSQAGKKMRAVSRELIRTRLEREPNNPDLLGMLAVIRKCEARDWTKDELDRWSGRVEVK